MSDKLSQTELLAREFLEHARKLNTGIDAIRVLKARAYRIGEASVLIRAASGGGRRYFFGLNYIHAEEIANLDNPFVAFICGSVQKTIIIPAQILIGHLPQISHDRNGEYKINIDANLNIVLSGRGNRLDCSGFINAWELLSNPPKIIGERNSAEESYHSVLQGRLLELGNIRGYQTFCPNKSKKFNGTPLGNIATLKTCPQLQFSDYDVLRQIDVLWFREKGKNMLPECAFEVELSTGTWSGVGRMATLLDYVSTKLFVVSNESRRYEQVMHSFADFKARYRFIPTEDLGDLYAAELSLRELRLKLDL
ncbi:MAG TPA: hypothetical protein VGB73_00965 [Pyrinomonadaceae bacterium]|jgi:hypothetical protein